MATSALVDSFKASRKRRETGNFILELRPNGDPYGFGFEASESQDGGESWFYRGDIGSMPRSFWRSYARRHGYILREAK